MNLIILCELVLFLIGMYSFSMHILVNCSYFMHEQY